MKMPLKVLKVLSLCAVLALVACNQKRPTQRFNSRENVRAPVGMNNPGVAQSCGGNCAWGKFFDGGEGSFEELAKDFGSVTVPRAEIGSINGSLNGTDTGVWFWGEMILEGGTISSLVQGSTPSLSLSKNSKLAVVIYDSHAVALENKVNPITSLFTGTQNGWDLRGTVVREGAQLRADLQFWDQWGQIRLVGNLVVDAQKNGLFQGDVYFANQCSMVPTETGGACEGPAYPQRAPTTQMGIHMGKFSVETCRFFSCQ